MDKFNLTDLSAYVLQTINARHYRKLLAAIECEASRCGYAFEQGKGGNLSTLPPELRVALAGALAQADGRAFSWGLREVEVAANDLPPRTASHESLAWLDEILLALQTLGVGLVRQTGSRAVVGERLVEREA